jgi:hypothetical protein
MVSVIASCAGQALAHEEVMVARTASNQLTMHTHDQMPFGLGASVIPGITGFASADIAFASLETDDPGEDIFTLPATVDVRAVLLSVSPNMRVYNGLTQMQVGDEMTLGAPVIHYVPIWNITQGNPGEESFAVFQFRDASNQLTSSAPFFITFTPVPAPGVLGIAGAGLVLAFRRRR